MQEDYKASKEAFVSHQSGSTVTHVNLISSVALLSIALYSTLRSRLHQNEGLNLITEFIVLVMPLLLSMTVFANNPLLLDAILGLPTLLLLWIPGHSQHSLSSSHSPSNPSFPTVHKDMAPDSKKVIVPSTMVTPVPALTTYRTHMLVMTFLAILAVDFPIFPRSLAKCETFGVSLMDIGVGSFVFSQGVVSAIPLLKNPSLLSEPLLGKVVTVSRKTLPLVLLGLLRVILVKGTEYPEHESEYGTHWNFFLTLALLQPLQVLLHPILLYLPIIGVGLGITILHQLALSNSYLQEWALNAPRSNLISQNKEGIVSLPGYLAIHILGLLIGTIVLPSSPSDLRRVQDRIRRDSDGATSPAKPDKSRSGQDVNKALLLFPYASMWWSLFDIGRTLGLAGNVSRRLANAQYVLWVAAYNTSFITAYLALDSYFYPPLPKVKPLQPVSDSLSPISAGGSELPPESLMQSPQKTAILLEAINLNGLPLFLLANVATGLVNLTVRTMYTSDSEALVILSLYAFGISAVAWVMRKRRLWKL